MNNRDYAPYFRNGLLYLPSATVELLVEAGLERPLAETALRGLALDDHKAEIAQINRVLETALAQMEEDSQEFQALTSDEAHFLLTGIPANI